MEDECFQEYKSLVREITKGMDQVKQLRASSSGNQEMLLGRMLASYEEALLILNGSAPQEQHQSVVSSASDPPDPPVSAYKVTRSKVSSSNPRERTLQRTTQVSVKSDNLYEELDDGYSWRKYGQKDILGSKYPRGYYRCTHRLDRGCLATKMVQRLDDDSSIVKITYRGKHTCEPLVPQVASREKLE